MQATVTSWLCDPKPAAFVTVDVTVTEPPALSVASCAAVKVIVWS